MSEFPSSYRSDIMYLPMLTPRGGGPWAYVGHFIFFEEFLIKIPTLGSKKWFKSGQISLPWRQIVSNIWPCICEFYYTLRKFKCRLCLKSGPFYY